MAEINPCVRIFKCGGGIQLICRGVWDGLSSQEAMERYPDEWERFLADPYAHRAPRAESYHDLSGMFPFSYIR